MLGRKLSHRVSPVIALHILVYSPLLTWSLKNVKLVMLGAFACLALTVFLAANVGSEFLPALDEGNIWIRVTVLPTSVSLEESLKIAKRLRQLVSTFPEIAM